jgi:hypothetical protein
MFFDKPRMNVGRSVQYNTGVKEERGFLLNSKWGLRKALDSKRGRKVGEA